MELAKKFLTNGKAIIQQFDDDQIFKTMVKLAIFFFVVGQTIDIVNAMQILPERINSENAYSSFNSVFLVTLTVMRYVSNKMEKE